MSSPTPSPNGNTTTSSIQRLAIAAGALIVVILTVVIALFLAAQDLPEGGQTPVSLVSPTATATGRPTTAPALPSPSPTTPPTETPSATPTPSATLEPTGTPLPSPTGTDTPVPLTPTPPPTPVIIIVTPTPLPVTPQTGGGVCQPPPTWVIYQVQAGDTLNSLASRTNTTVFDLQQVNCLPSITLQPGQTIYLPFTPPPPTQTPTAVPTRPSGPTPTRSPTPTSPQIDSVTPSRVDEIAAQNEVVITVLGRNFRSQEAGFTVELRGPQSVTLQLTGVRSDTNFEAIVPPNLRVGTYDLVVTNPNTDRAGIRSSAYTIGPAPPTDTPAAPPDINDFTPASGSISEQITLIVQGRNFRPNQSGFRVELRKTSGNFKVELDVLNDPAPNDRSFSALIPANTLEVGNYNLVVTNPDGQLDIAPGEYVAFQ